MPLSVLAQEGTDSGIRRLLHNLQYTGETQATLSTGDYAPFWLTSNKQGLSSVENSSAYLRGSLIRPVETDSMRKWQVGYGVDVALAAQFTSSLVIQQCFGDVRYRALGLSVGAKERPMELKNNQLSTGSQTLGINARPVPQVRVEVPEWWVVPYTRGWVQVKGHVAYGKYTDNTWQHDFTSLKTRYTDNALFHSKAGYLRIYNEDYDYPLSLELGLEMATQFGGTTYMKNKEGVMQPIENESGLKAFWNAFIPGGGGDPYENQYQFQNAEGNHLGSYLIRLNYDKRDWRASIYADHFFEDQSSMFFLDYNGYGTGASWNDRQERKYFLYDLKDIMLGAEVWLKRGTWVRNIVAEYIYSKYQCGPVYHDHNPGTSDHISGMDEYYNHYIYPGWQHWGQVMGNPLYTSPLYNEKGEIYIKDSRFLAFHIGISGQPTKELSYRLLGTWKEGLGTYKQPFTKHKQQVNIMAEGNYAFSQPKLKGWSVGVGLGYDNGEIVGDNFGCQVTIRKTGLFNF